MFRIRTALCLLHPSPLEHAFTVSCFVIKLQLASACCFCLRLILQIIVCYLSACPQRLSICGYLAPVCLSVSLSACRVWTYCIRPIIGLPAGLMSDVTARDGPWRGARRIHDGWLTRRAAGSKLAFRNRLSALRPYISCKPQNTHTHTQTNWITFEMKWLILMVG
jgi:hypothetical protein